MSFVTLPATGSQILVLPIGGSYLPVSALALDDGTPVDAGHPLPVTSVVTSLPAVTFAAPQHVIVDSATLGTVAVSGPIAATQSGAWSVTVASLPSISGSVSISNFPATQPISGTVAATQSGTWTTVLGAGSAAIGTVAFASAQHVIIDSATLGTVAVSGAVTTSGTVTEANSATIATNTGRLPSQGQALAAASLPVVLPVLQAAALAQDATLTGGGLRGTVALSAGAAAIGSVSVSNLPATQPVSGAVTANIGTAGTLALEAGNLATILARTPALGQALAAAASPVVLTAAQDVVAYGPAKEAGGHLAAIDTSITTTATQTTTTATNTGATNTKLAGGLPAALGAHGGLVIEGVASGVAVPTSLATLPALTAGSAVIGHVITDTGSTTAVTSLPALAAGSAAIGSVTVTSAPTTAITAAALPLPAGAALEAGNLASILADFVTLLARVPALGQALASASVPVVDASTLTTTATQLLVGGLLIKTGPGVLFYVSVQNYSGTTVNVMIFDATAAPSATTLPPLAAITVATAATGVAVVGAAGKGITFTSGILLIPSTSAGAGGYVATVATITGLKILASYL